MTRPKMRVKICKQVYIFSYKQIPYDDRYFMIHLDSLKNEPVVKVSSYLYEKVFKHFVAGIGINLKSSCWEKFLDNVDKYDHYLDCCDD